MGSLTNLSRTAVNKCSSNASVRRKSERLNWHKLSEHKPTPIKLIVGEGKIVDMPNHIDEKYKKLVLI